MSLIGSFYISDLLQKKVSANGLNHAINLVLVISGISTFVETLM